MPPKKREDAQDTIEHAQHYLNYLARQGWGLVSFEEEVIYGKAGKGGPDLPVEAVVTIKLRPAKP